jgi:hypothetical protein
MITYDASLEDTNREKNGQRKILAHSFFFSR